jgi:spore maturation protein CgeB
VNVAVVSGFRRGYTVGLEYSYSRALEALGCRVTRVATISDSSKAHTRRDTYHRVLHGRPGLVLVIKGAEVGADTLRKWRLQGLPCVNIFPDNPFEAAAVTFRPNRVINALRAYDRVYVHDRIVVGQLLRLGVAADYVAFAQDPTVHARVDPAAGGTDSPPLVFIGNPDSERVRYLRAIADLNLQIWGNWHWARLGPSDPLRDCVRGGVRLGRDFSYCLRGGAIGINILRNSQKTAHNMRTFELPACGACTLSERSIGVLEHMNEDVDVVTFATPEELRERAIVLQRDHQLRQSIADQGWHRVQQECYTARAAQVIAPYMHASRAPQHT